MKKRKINGINETDFYIKYTSNGNEISKISKSAEKNVKQNEWLKGVSCFIVNDKNEVLLEQRVNRGLTPGKLDLCSGHIDNYEVPMQAMIRELEEELSVPMEDSFLNLRQLKPTDCPLVFENNGKTRNFFITFFCLKKNFLDVKYQKDEIDNIKWFKMEEVFKMIKTGQTKFPEEFNYESIFKQVENIANNDKCIKEEIER